jgi:hypothetical protein
MHEQREQAASGSPGPQHGSSAAGLPIDIEKLAEKVYRLMRDDIRLTQARGRARKTRR